jgi:Fe-S-cluster-containing hydrogenase component 2
MMRIVTDLYEGKAEVFACDGCNLCVESCPTSAIVEENGKKHVDKELCNTCGICVEACPKRIIYMTDVAQVCNYCYKCVDGCVYGAMEVG